MKEVEKLPWITDIKRHYQIHGYTYSFEPEYRNKPKYVGEIPACFSLLVDRIVEGNLLPEKPDQCVVNKYEAGQGIGSHVDSLIFGNQVINVSLGSDIVMDFHGPQDEKKSILLPRRSMLLVEGPARFDWAHGIAPRKTDKLENGTVLKRGKRVSLTFRVVSKEKLGE